MSKVIQIRDVPDEAHDALAEEARARGMSLTKYVRGELEHLANRAKVARGNADVVRRTKADVGAHVERQTILDALDEGRRG